MAYINDNHESTPSNQSKVFKLIYQSNKISKQALSQTLKMSLPTITQSLNILEDMHLITESGEFESKGGRKAKAITYIPDQKYSIGLDITKTHVGIILINLAGEILEHTRFQKSFFRSHRYFESIAELIENFISAQEIPKDRILGVGISIPGILDESGNRIVYLNPLGISNMDCREFSEFIPYPCMFCNAANAASIAEMWNKQVEHNVAYLFLSNCVGGSIIINDQVYLGDNRRSAEFGHMTLVPEGRACYCGKKGCLDAYCAADLLISPELNTESLEDFFIKLKNNDAKCAATWSEYLRYLAIAINNLRMLLDCDVVLGGYIGSFIEDYIQILRAEVIKLNTFEDDALYLKSCSYKIEASAVGAALINIESFINKL